jgi:hypothetical protein
MKNRGLKRLIASTIVIILTVGAIKSYHWYDVGEEGSYPVSDEIKGRTLSYSEAMEASNEYKSSREYYYKYFVEIKYKRGSFPTIIEEVDTVKTELWHRKKRN